MVPLTKELDIVTITVYRQNLEDVGRLRHMIMRTTKCNNSTQHEILKRCNNTSFASTQKFKRLDKSRKIQSELSSDLSTKKKAMKDF